MQRAEEIHVTESREPHVTLHLCPVPVWEAQRHAETYLPEAYDADGFIHCTDGDERVIWVANHFYTADPRDFVVLSVDLDANGSPWKFEDPERVFPHIYGPIHPSSVRQIRPVHRAADGAFLSIGEIA
jgi:uncharacterized protein (DUF952 family)